MTFDSRLEVGDIRKWRVRSRHTFGLVVEDARDAELIGVVDLIYVSDTKIASEDDLPAPGTEAYAVVQGYTPAGQLRLSMLDADIERARQPRE